MASELVPILQAISPFASAGVAAVAIGTTWLQSKHTLALSERQSRIEEAKLRSQLFDKRYDTWAELSKFAWARITAVEDPKSGNGWDDLNGFEDASDRMFFLFGDDVNNAIDALDTTISIYHMAVNKEFSPIVDATAAQMAAERLVEVRDAERECGESYERLKALVRKYMELGPESVTVRRRRLPPVTLTARTQTAPSPSS